jgi:hypothetical protein
MSTVFRLLQVGVQNKNPEVKQFFLISCVSQKKTVYTSNHELDICSVLIEDKRICGDAQMGLPYDAVALVVALTI